MRSPENRSGKLLLVLLFLAVFPVLASAQPADRERKTENIILITADGLRHQELFTGVDSSLLENPKKGGIENVEKLKAKFWRPTAKERREALLPFFWSTLAPRGVVLGNKSLSSSVKLSNPHRVSFPGYAELLTGQAQKDITDNTEVRIGRETVLEFVRGKRALERTRVAAFASWSTFEYITAHRAGSIVCNAGYRDVPTALATPGMRKFHELQRVMLTPWDTVRHDVVTAGLALEYLAKHKPRLLYLALGETDDWAHDRRYDRVVAAIQIFDQTLRVLWDALQSMDEYRDRTTIIVKTDHGRGGTLEDWTSHGKDVAGAEDIWIAIAGPDTPARGELASTPAYSLSNVAATLLAFLGMDHREFNPDSLPPIESALTR